LAALLSRTNSTWLSKLKCEHKREREGVTVGHSDIHTRDLNGISATIVTVTSPSSLFQTSTSSLCAMPAKKSTGPPKKRRSSRLKDRQGQCGHVNHVLSDIDNIAPSVAATDALVAARAKFISAPKRGRKGQSATIPSTLNRRGDDEESTSTAEPPLVSGPEGRRSQRITHQALDRREKTLSQKEEDLKRKSLDLQQRIESVEDKVNEASTMMSSIVVREKESMLKQLEDHFLCSL